MTSPDKTTSDAEKTSRSRRTPGSSPDGSALPIEKKARRENVKDKGKRLLVSGRLRVVKVDGQLIVAECRGDSGAVYSLGYDPRMKQWRCTCAARTACSHMHALWAVVAL